MKQDLLAYAYKLLSRRAYTRLGMARKLSIRGEPDNVETVLDQLTESGYLDDRAFAQNYIQSRVANHPSGRRLLEMKLRTKGIPTKAIREVLDEIKPEAEEAAAQDLAKKKAATLKNLEPIARKRRIFQFLINRGFSPKIAGKFSNLN
ncbi:MAG: regulatory protein RecX [Candidatus Omnitrophota bacterium]|nr:recombination regulator RecX [Candidatus Omnitrophota bacterium]